MKNTTLGVAAESSADDDEDVEENSNSGAGSSCGRGRGARSYEGRGGRARGRGTSRGGTASGREGATNKKKRKHMTLQDFIEEDRENGAHNTI